MNFRKFIVVFLIAVVGFAISFHGLFKHAMTDDETRTFETLEQTMKVLFDAALGQHDFTMFQNEPYQYWGEILFAVYITITMVVLLNLVIATFSVRTLKQ